MENITIFNGSIPRWPLSVSQVAARNAKIKKEAEEMVNRFMDEQMEIFQAGLEEAAKVDIK